MFERITDDLDAMLERISHNRSESVMISASF